MSHDCSREQDNKLVVCFFQKDDELSLVEKKDHREAVGCSLLSFSGCWWLPGFATHHHHHLIINDGCNHHQNLQLQSVCTCAIIICPSRFHSQTSSIGYFISWFLKLKRNHLQKRQKTDSYRHFTRPARSFDRVDDDKDILSYYLVHHKLKWHSQSDVCAV